MAHLLEVKNLEVAFHTKDGIVRAVNSISYTLDAGDTLGIVGESGSGKSVSLLAMMGLIPMPPGKIEGGEVLFEGKDILRLKGTQWAGIRGKQIAMVFQDPMTSLNPVMTIGNQIAEAVMINLGYSKSKAWARAIEVLTQVGIPRAEDRMKNYPHEFSGGMRQRVMIAMAISCQPKLLIADEPTTALDVTIQAQIIDLVKKLQQDYNMAVIWVTHDLGVVARLAKRIMVMYGGRIMESGPIKPLYKNPRHPYTIGLLGSVPGAEVDKESALRYIKGNPPDMIRIPKGCPFSPRCDYANEKCLERPELLPIENDSSRLCACWNLDMVCESLGKIDTGRSQA